MDFSVFNFPNQMHLWSLGQFFGQFHISRKRCQISNLVDSAQGPDLAPFYGDLSQSEKISEVKPPLVFSHLIKGKKYKFLAAEQTMDMKFGKSN